MSSPTKVQLKKGQVVRLFSESGGKAILAGVIEMTDSGKLRLFLAVNYVGAISGRKIREKIRRRAKLSPDENEAKDVNISCERNSSIVFIYLKNSFSVARDDGPEIFIEGVYVPVESLFYLPGSSFEKLDELASDETG